jgi:hypothetical protein
MGGTGAVSARLASGDFSGAALVGIAAASIKTVVDSSLGFFRKKKIDLPKTNAQSELESKIINLIHSYNSSHAIVEQNQWKTGGAFFFTFLFFLLAFLLAFGVYLDGNI